MKRTKSKDRKTRNFNQEFPGYPHYPVKEDIMNTNRKKLAIDMENPEAPLREPAPEVITPENSLPEKDSPEDVRFVKGNPADVTKTEREELGDLNLAMQMGDDEDLKNRPEDVDIAGSDLVVPGAELDDEDETIGREDEENNLYSLGGDNHDKN